MLSHKNDVTEFRLNGDGRISDWVVTIGNFDGLHLGHQHLLGKMKDYASLHHLGTRLISFEPHPKEVLNAPTPFAKLYDLDQKIELCRRLNLDSVVIIPFTKTLANIEAELFVNDYMLRNCQISKIYVGYNFLFGKNRSGSLETLQSCVSTRSIPIERVDVYNIALRTVSSSLIRDMLYAGKFKDAEQCLGRPWTIDGAVCTGKKLGRTIGFPTINMKPQIVLPLKFGVYASEVNVSGRRFSAVTNIGVKPTISGSSSVTVETHIMNFNGDLYDCAVSVRPVSFLRPEKKFNDMRELKAQIALDVKKAKTIIKTDLCL